MAVLMPQQKQKEKEDDDFTKILKGLQVGASLYGIYADTQKISQMKADTELKNAQQQRELESFKRQGVEHEMKVDEYNKKKDGVIGPTDAAKFDVSREPGPGRVQAIVNGEKVWLKERPPASTLNPQDKEPKQNQFAAATYANRAVNADKVMADLAANGYDRSERKQATLDAVGETFGLDSDGHQKQDQAELDFLSAVLRKESGASINDTERSMGEKQYFDRAGNSPELKLQKAANRAAAIAGLQAEGQPAAARVAAKQAALTPPKQAGGKQGAENAAQAGLIPPKSLDPKIEAYSKQNALSYEQGAAIINERTKKLGNGKK